MSVNFAAEAARDSKFDLFSSIAPGSAASEGPKSALCALPGMGWGGAETERTARTKKGCRMDHRVENCLHTV